MLLQKIPILNYKYPDRVHDDIFSQERELFFVMFPLKSEISDSSLARVGSKFTNLKLFKNYLFKNLW